jgi:hypothetical protein
MTETTGAPKWRGIIAAPDDVIMPLPLTGFNPTLLFRTQSFQARPIRDCLIHRFLFSKVGTGRITAMLFLNDELQTPEPFDADLIGSPQLLGVRLKFPVVRAGSVIRAELTWHPAPWLCRMSLKEYERRKRLGNWAVSWLGHRLRIEGDKAKRRRVVDRREPKLSIPDFHQGVLISACFLVRIAK